MQSECNNLIQALSHQSASTREYAAESLGHLGDKAAVPALIRSLRDRDFSVRFAAITALGKIGDASAVPALIKWVRDYSWMARSHAITALGEIGDASAVPALIEALHRRYHWLNSAPFPISETSRNAAEALGKIGGEAAIAALIEALRYDEPNLYTTIITTLVKIGGDAIPALVQALRDSKRREGAALALGMIGEEALPALAQALQNNETYVRGYAASGLSGIGGKAIPVLLPALQDPCWPVRHATARSLGEIGDRCVIPELTQALQDRVFHVQHAAAVALSKMGEDGITVLLLSLQDRNVALPVAIALGEIGEVVAVPLLIEALRHHDPEVRQAAVPAFGKIGDAALLPRKILASAQLSVVDQITLLETLGRIHLQVGVPLKYDVLPIADYCRTILNTADVTEAEQAGATKILAQQMLLRPGRRDPERESEELLRSASSAESSSASAELVRAVEER